MRTQLCAFQFGGNAHDEIDGHSLQFVSGSLLRARRV
jgi:hypothetical protein